MGNKIVRSTAGMAAKPVRDFNIEERAHRAVRANKYTPSPKHPRTLGLIEESIRNLPDQAKKELEGTSEDFGKRLESVYVTSRDGGNVTAPPRATPARPLPQERLQPTPWTYGHHPPAHTPYGKLTIKDALDLLAAHAQDRRTSAGVHALQYKLDTRLTTALLKHFGTYRLVTPVERALHEETLLEELENENVVITPSELPNTENIRRMLQGVALSSSSVEEGAYIPSEQVLLKVYHPDNTDPEDTATFLNPEPEDTATLLNIGTEEEMAKMDKWLDKKPEIVNNDTRHKPV